MPDNKCSLKLGRNLKEVDNDTRMCQVIECNLLSYRLGRGEGERVLQETRLMEDREPDVFV